MYYSYVYQSLFSATLYTEHNREHNVIKFQPQCELLLYLNIRKVML